AGHARADAERVSPATEAGFRRESRGPAHGGGGRGKRSDGRLRPFAIFSGELCCISSAVSNNTLTIPSTSAMLRGKGEPRQFRKCGPIPGGREAFMPRTGRPKLSPHNEGTRPRSA